MHLTRVHILRNLIKNSKIMHIGIAGNIGCGKTTLTRMLAEHYGWTPKFESVTHNPYLEDYYKDIERWSYNLETYFLAQRFQDVLDIAKSEDVIIQDRTLMEGVYIFVANNKAMGNLSDRDFNTYMHLFSLMMSMVKKPDLLIYLKSSVPHLVSQIQKRGRDYEKSISIEYLNNLNERYDEWIGNYEGQVLVIECDELDFQNRPEDFALITDRIDAQLYGLF
jgi:deoxyadenosine/deoxycytidine kinase